MRIIGSGFQVGATVTFGGTRQYVSTQTSQRLSLTTMPHHAGIVEIVVTGPQGQVEKFDAAFEYAPPETFDFNGHWTDDHGLEVFIAGNVVTGITCGGVDVPLPAPLLVRLGAFSLTTDRGFEVVSGRIVTDGVAVGHIETAACRYSPWSAVRK